MTGQWLTETSKWVGNVGTSPWNKSGGGYAQGWTSPPKPKIVCSSISLGAPRPNVRGRGSAYVDDPSDRL